MQAAIGIFHKLINLFQKAPASANEITSSPVVAAIVAELADVMPAEKQHRKSTEYGPGTHLRGIITGIKEYGIFVHLPNGEKGLVYQSEIIWPGEDEVSYQLRQSIDVITMSFKPGYGLALSIREARFLESFNKFARKYPLGSVIQGKIKSVRQYGVFVNVAPGIRGLLHIKHIPNMQMFTNDCIGKPIDVRVLGINYEKLRIDLG